jgi:transcription initiation factor TFIIB
MAEAGYSNREKMGCRPESIIIDEFTGTIICKDTAIVLEQTIDHGIEWRAFDPENNRTRSRIGGPLTSTTHDYSITTDISTKDIMKVKQPHRRRQFYSIRRHNAAARIRGHKRLVRALQLITYEGKKLNLPQRTLETASNYIRKVVKKRLGRGEMLRAYIAASLFIASRVTKVPRSFSAIVKELGVNEEQARYAYRKIIELSGGKISATVYKPSDYIPQIATKLGLSRGTIELMYRIDRAVEKLNLVHGKSPLAIAAAIAYIASPIMGEKKNQREIAEAIGSFTDVAIRNRYREIVDNLYIEVLL